MSTDQLMLTTRYWALSPTADKRMGAKAPILLVLFSQTSLKEPFIIPQCPGKLQK